MNIDKLQQKINNLSINTQKELFNYIYNNIINEVDNQSIMNIINSCEQILKDRSFLIDNFNGNDVKDFILYENGYKINCRLHSNSVILGINNHSEFIIGTITSDFNIYLLKVSNYTNTIHSLEGKLNGLIIDGNWKNGRFNDALYNIFSNSENPLYDELPSKRIDSFALMLKELYNKQKKEFKEIIQNIVNKDKSINTCKTKILN